MALLQRSYRVLGAETGWRRLTRRIHANKSEVQYCGFEFRTSSNLRQNFCGAVDRIVVIAEQERPVNSLLSVRLAPTGASFFMTVSKISSTA